VVLNHDRSGLAAFQLAAYPVAEKSFDESLSRIEAVFAANAEAEKARSLYYKENIKTFKGEPYERVMAYYYRGLLYLMDGDYENARASFRGGMIQDGLAEQEKYREDFALMAFLEGWSSQCLGQASLAKERFDEAVNVSSLGSIQVPDAAHNLLLIAEAGKGPRKLGTGEFKHVLQFERSPGNNVARVEFSVGSKVVTAFPAEDIYWQATTRGGRQIDALLDNKAVWKGDLDKVADVAMTVGGTAAMMGAMSGNNDAAIAGGIMMLMGAIAKANAAAMHPEADIRQWDNLPEIVHVATTMTGPPGTPVTVNFMDTGRQVVNSAPVSVAIKAAGACSIGWTRSESALDVADAAPGAIARPAANAFSFK